MELNSQKSSSIFTVSFDLLKKVWLHILGVTSESIPAVTPVDGPCYQIRRKLVTITKNRKSVCNLLDYSKKTECYAF